MIRQVVVTDAWLSHENETVLNPALKPYERRLLSMRQTWSPDKNYTPLTWYAERKGNVSAVELLLGALPDSETLSDISGQGSFEQYWMVSPYHVRLVRSTLRVMPESMLQIPQHVAEQLMAIVNPLLADEGMRIFYHHGSMILGCNRSRDVAPESFANITGGFLPDRMPDGRDAGEWMRLLSETQMALHQQPVFNDAGIQIHGLWFWGGSNGVKCVDPAGLPAAATMHQQLRTLLTRLGRDAKPTMIITEAEYLPELLPKSQKLPAHWLLLGSGHAVELKKSILHSSLARVRKKRWQGITARG